MTKADQFMMMAQTAIITKYATDPGDGTVPLARPMWSIEHMRDAFILSERIPGDVTAEEAANAFIKWCFSRDDLTADDETILEILIQDGI